HLVDGLARMREDADTVRQFRNQGFVVLGYSCIQDYARERLGMGATQAREMSLTGVRLRRLPAVREAWHAGRLSFSKVVALCRAVQPDEEAEWVAKAERLTVRGLVQDLREAHPSAVDDDEPRPGQWLQGGFDPEEAADYDDATELVRRELGADVSPTDCLEILMAEFLSGTVHLREPGDSDVPEPQPVASKPVERRRVRERLSLPLAPQNLPEAADPWALDAALVAVQRGSHRAHTWVIRLLRILDECGYASMLGFGGLRSYARERLGMSGSLARLLVGLDRDLSHCPTVWEALLAGRLTQTKAAELGRVVHTTTEDAWIAYARTVTARDLRLIVHAALCQNLPLHRTWPPGRRSAQMSAAAVSQYLPLPGQERAQMSAGVPESLPLPGQQPAQMSADAAAAEDPTFAAEPPTVRTVRLWLPRDLQALWKAVCSVLKRLTDQTPTPKQALAVLASYFNHEYAAEARQSAKQYPIQERDGWRCQVPHCTRRRALHAHHIIYKSHGGPDAPWNRISLCLVHHLRAVHMGHIRITGRAPDRLTWHLGVRPDGPAHLVIIDRAIQQRPA
ncbi:MAG: HNH endonuclease, partial [Candidatus Xenobia bacterium]